VERSREGETEVWRDKGIDMEINKERMVGIEA
jgi:hypothetical protein